MKFEMSSQTIFVFLKVLSMFLNRFFKIFSLVFVLAVSGILFLFPSVRNSIVLKSSDILTIVDKAFRYRLSVIESKVKGH